MGDLVVCEFVASSISNGPGNRTPTSMVIDAFGYIVSENRDRDVRSVNEMLLIKTPNARRVVRLKVRMKNRNVQFSKHKEMRMKVVKYIRSDLRDFQALKHFKTLTICPSILSPRVDQSAFEWPHNFRQSSNIVNDEDLNQSQRIAIRRATEACFVDGPKICMIQGPPGTGKSRVISCLVMQLLHGVVAYDKRNRDKGIIPRILLCAPSNAAVDVLVTRLLEERRKLPRDKRFKMVRVGRTETMHPKVKDISLQELAKRELNHHANMDVSSIETELRMTEARLRASEHASEAAQSTRDRRGVDQKHEDTVRELKRRMTVLQNRLQQAQNSDAQRSTENITPAAEREAQKRILRGADIVATTLSSCFTKIMENVFPPRSNGEYNFTCCIIDEATQCYEVQTLTPLMLGVRTLVLVGDPKQLPATVLSQNARNCGLGNSLFTRMVTDLPKAVHFLEVQYRMHPDIMAWPNRYFYNRKLKSPENFALARVSPLTPYSVIRLPYRQDSCSKEENTEEAKFVIALAIVIAHKLVESLTSAHDLSVGIITPYQKQRQRLSNLLTERCAQNQTLKEIIDINTFDSFQGQEKDVIIMSCVRTDKIGFLNDPQRLNVALTRAKFSLLLCGNFEALYGDSMWSSLLQDAQSRRVIKDIQGRLNDKELWSLVALKE